MLDMEISQFYQYIPTIAMVIWTRRKQIISKMFDYSKTKIGFFIFSPITLPVAIYFLCKIVSSDGFTTSLEKFKKQTKITDFVNTPIT